MIKLTQLPDSRAHLSLFVASHTAFPDLITPEDVLSAVLKEELDVVLHFISPVCGLHVSQSILLQIKYPAALEQYDYVAFSPLSFHDSGMRRPGRSQKR